MKQIFFIGETLLDTTFRERQPVAAQPGGAMPNGVDTRLVDRYNTGPTTISEDFAQQVTHG